jgi:hypothetical protein
VFNFMSCMCMSMRQCGCLLLEDAYSSYVSTMCVNVYLTCGFSYCVCCETMQMTICVCGDEFAIWCNYMFFVFSHVEGNKIGSTFVCC